MAEQLTSHAVITEEMLAQVRSRIGKAMRPKVPYYNTIACRDAIVHFADGLGDPNPLYRDPAYAANTRYRRIVAPPSFLYSVYWPSGGVMGMGLPGIHGWHAGNDWEYFKPILEGDIIDYEEVITDLSEKKGRSAGRIFIQTSVVTYFNQRKEVIARAKGWMVRAERQAAGEKGKYKDLRRGSYTPEQMQAVYKTYDEEIIRGANTRYWEDVQVGEGVQPIVKGPLSVRDMIAWDMGAGTPFMKAHKIFYDYVRRHPRAVMIDHQTGQLDVPELVHMEETRAQEIGIAGAYDYGSQRISWLSNLLTNWQGDDGFLRKLYAELRLFNVVGDTTWLKGRVVKKYVENGEHLVDIECWGENQRGEVTLPGRATVRLPSKAAGKK
ncbi:MAG: MaoC family dehydratase N-terminal domain-containing protein [Chloroflexi bacterium]|nr:MaoC family dehydratase N-terminal domain-containing protein [Chloroflexota bacterium]